MLGIEKHPIVGADVSVAKGIAHGKRGSILSTPPALQLEQVAAVDIAVLVKIRGGRRERT